MTGRLPGWSMLDAGEIPVAQVADLARREGVRPRDAYGAHKWFARRPPVTARSLLAAAATPAGGDFWGAYRAADLSGVRVLDPFAGGGVMPLEAARLGADVHAVDVEPVAAAVAGFQGRLAALPPLGGALDDLAISVGEEVAPFYAARHGDRRGRLLHAFWVQVVTCRCGRAYDAHPSYGIAEEPGSARRWTCCSGCGDVMAHEGPEPVTCGCGAATDPAAGVLAYGKATCPGCGVGERLIDVAARTGGPPSFRMFAVETVPEGPERKCPIASRLVRAAEDADLAAYAAASGRLAREVAADPAFLAPGAVPVIGRADDRLPRYGYRAYAELYNARQSLHLGLLARALDGTGGAVGEAMRVAFSDHASTNNMMCGYIGGWRRLSPLFALRAYRHIARPCEVNPWLRLNGRGTFPNAVRSVERAARSLRASEEPVPGGGRGAVPVRSAGSWDVRCGDASDLAHVPDGSVDLVLTDPPYFDAIPYSELGHFFVPWMVRLGLVDASHLDGFPHGQVATASRGEDGEGGFAAALEPRLREVARKCRPGGRVAFTYQNLDGRGWRALGRALAGAGLEPRAAFPMYGDGGAGPHRHEGSVTWDCVVVCVPGPARPYLQPDAADLAGGERLADAWAARLRGTGHRFAASDRVNLAHAGAMVSAWAAAGERPAAA